MKYALIGIGFLILAVFFREKGWNRLKAIAYYIAIVFLALGAIGVWVGDFREILSH